ncbi:MAG: alpha-amylase family glycosyl hydrolase [Anaerolineales bacterium]|nr:alpha-amylase family glycosyl hydrolase [Anaerolineales bacterium]MCX7755921.1 alpha-amylase family glycosyl hydrolase [Anaerolineales bacterium]MDW8276893.1 alpha-amylase family glycosyl hydrolase [Anaerolineales bacterium]
MKPFILFTLFMSLLISCTVSPTPDVADIQPAQPTQIELSSASGQSLPWWREAIFYEIFVRSFQDSDGNGIGDFQGIIQRLDYLQSLGVTALWLMPIHPSPSYHGYDVLNYYAVNPTYGTMQDFKQLLAEAHQRQIRVIIDFVPNHTSSQHPFFQAALNPQSPYRNYYVWSDTDPGQKGPYGGPAWHKASTGYYYGLFWGGMPDLNYTNPEVTAQIKKVVRFWLTDVGVDGFRIDAVKHLIEENGKQENTPATHAWLREFYTFYKNLNAEFYTVGEVYGAGGTLIRAYGGGEEQMDHIFNFELASGYLNSARGEANSSAISALKFTLAGAPHGNYATFLTNHDQERVMSVFKGNVGQAKTAASMLLTGPGTPYLYYGEEIGMSGQKPDEYIRTPMQWSAEPGAGFTTGQPWIRINEDYRTKNVAAQENDPASLLNHYRKLIALRRENLALRIGEVILVETGNPAVYAILRRSEQQTALILINLSKQPITDYKLTLTGGALRDGEYTLRPLFGTTQTAKLEISGGGFAPFVPLSRLEAYTTYIFLLE